MYFLLSGEGPTDIGLCHDNMDVCEGNLHRPGPMAIIVSQIAEQQHGVSFMDTGEYGYVSKKKLVQKAKKFKSQKKPHRLTGKKKAKETGYFYRNARALALCAMEKMEERGDDVIAVLFRDSDGTASAGRGLWQDKWDSMIRGFNDEGFGQGVPMIPKPKSEAWIICCLKPTSYQHCETLEDRSGNDRSPKSLKGELEEILGFPPSREQLCDLVNNGAIDCNRINMPSFSAFKDALLALISPELR